MQLRGSGARLLGMWLEELGEKGSEGCACTQSGGCSLFHCLGEACCGQLCSPQKDGIFSERGRRLGAQPRTWSGRAESDGVIFLRVFSREWDLRPRPPVPPELWGF